MVRVVRIVAPQFKEDSCTIVECTGGRVRIARTILLVEDDRDLCDAMALALHRRGYEVQAANDAVEAEEFLERGLPDLLITDMMLPGASGFYVMRRMEEQSQGRVPVLMMSANTSRAHRDYALSAGASGFLAKPFALAELVAAAEKFCPLPVLIPAELAAAGP